MNAIDHITAGILCASAAMLGLSAGEVDITLIAPAPVHTCVGCAGVPTEDPVTGMTVGFLTLVSTAGFTTTGNVTFVSKSCSPGAVDNNDDNTSQICSPDGNCEFVGHFMGIGGSNCSSDRPNLTPPRSSPAKTVQPTRFTASLSDFQPAKSPTERTAPHSDLAAT